MPNLMGLLVQLVEDHPHPVAALPGWGRRARWLSRSCGHGCAADVCWLRTKTCPAKGAGCQRSGVVPDAGHIPRQRH
jgi:hypothetical protein